MPRPRKHVEAVDVKAVIELSSGGSGDSDSSDSVIVLEKPPKPVPPLVELTEDSELVLNVSAVAPELISYTATTESVEEMNPLSDWISPYHWTPEMRQFYNADWGNESCFIVADLQSKMKKIPRLWEISPRDAQKSAGGARCRRCGSSSHMERACPDRFRPKTCHMCGCIGHYSNQCPKSICLTCGAKRRDFINSCNGCCEQLRVRVCRRCELPGHSVVDCTDNWRRFHNTTSGNLGDVKIPDFLNTINRPWVNLWCCNCGERGHDAYYCHLSNESGYPKAFPFVVFYEKQIPVPLEVLQDGPPPKKRYFEVASESTIQQQMMNSNNDLTSLHPVVSPKPQTQSESNRALMIFRNPNQPCGSARSNDGNRRDKKSPKSSEFTDALRRRLGRQNKNFKTRYFYNTGSDDDFESRQAASHMNDNVSQNSNAKKKKKKKKKKGKNPIGYSDRTSIDFIPVNGRNVFNSKKRTKQNLKQCDKQNKE